MKYFHQPARSLCLAALLLLTQSACQHHSERQAYQPPNVTLPANFTQYVTPTASMDNTSDWWLTFNNPTLNRLMQQLNNDNQNIQASLAQYQAALAQLSSTQAGQRPTVNATFSANQGTIANTTALSTNSLPTNTSYSLGSTVSWEWDVWQRMQQQIDGQTALAQASYADLAAMRLSMQTLLAQTYFSLDASQRQLQKAKQSLEAYQRFLSLTQIRYHVGIASALDVAQAQTQLHSQQTQTLELEQQIAQYQNAIAALLGQSRQTLPPITTQPSTLPAAPTLIPSQLLMHRPDIIASERRVAAAYHQLGVAHTAFFPTLNLTASANYRNTELASLINLPNSIWSMGIGAAATLFDGGKRDAAVALAQANLEQANAHYRQTVLSALQEVEDNLVSLHLLQQAYQAQQAAVKAAEQATRIATSQYRAGTNSALNVITTQAAQWTAERILINLELKQQTATINLLKNTFQPLESLNLLR